MLVFTREILPMPWLGLNPLLLFSDDLLSPHFEGQTP